jgi:hypothetical protein
LSRSGERVFDGRIFSKELSGEVRAGEVFVVRWESVPLETEGADPEFSAQIELAVDVLDKIIY